MKTLMIDDKAICAIDDWLVAHPAQLIHLLEQLFPNLSVDLIDTELFEKRKDE